MTFPPKSFHVIRFRACQCSDLRPPTKRQKKDCSILKVNERVHGSVLSSGLGKIRGANLPQEYELARLFQAIDNPPMSWTTSTPACGWKSVMCDADLRVTRISLLDINLTGLLRLEWLPETLREFNVWRNNITGSAELGRLPTNIFYLGLSTNKFTGPLDLVHLPNTLDELDAESNQFDGHIELATLPMSLTHLRLHKNLLQGELNLLNLPKKLQYLNLSCNCFTGSLELQHLPSSLIDLYCANNLFSGLVRFVHLPARLETLDLEDNQNLQGEIDVSMLPESLSTTFMTYGTKIRFKGQTDTDDEDDEYSSSAESC